MNKSTESYIGIRCVRELSASSVDENKTQNSQSFMLHQNYPNPFNPETTIAYQVPKTSKISLMVYNIDGIEVADLVNN